MGIIGGIFLSSGLFLGWFLGSQDASNVFGTAVATRMVKFKTAALVCSIFVTLGAVISGVGTADTLGSLGAVNAIGGAFVTAFSAAFTACVVSKIGLTISVSQAVVGAVIGWNWFSQSVTDTDSLVKMAGTWVACPVIFGLLAIPLFAFFSKISKRVKLSLLQRDVLLRAALVVTGAFGSYSLGANNMANVVGVFVPVVPFTDFMLFGYKVTAIHQLFFIGSLAVSVGVYTYSYKVMMTVGKGLMPLTPFAAWVVVLCQGVVLFLFASEGLEYFLAARGLPTIPLVPVSSTQAVIGAVLGIGLYKGSKNISWKMLWKIMIGWVAAPVITAVCCFIFLFIMQNVFSQPVYIPKTYTLSADVLNEIAAKTDLPAGDFRSLQGRQFRSGQALVKAVRKEYPQLTNAEARKILSYAEVVRTKVVAEKIKLLPAEMFSEKQLADIAALSGRTFSHTWVMQNILDAENSEWAILEENVLNKQENNLRKRRIRILEKVFKLEEPALEGG